VRDVSASTSLQSTGYAEEGSSSRRNEERLAAVVGGAALVALAARDRSWRSIGLAIAGAPLVWRGATGAWPAVPRTVADRLPEQLPPSIEVTLTVLRPREEVYAFWRRLENLPRFMRHLDSVTETSPSETGKSRSHWVGKSPVGAKVEWDAEIVEEREGQILSWQSLPGSQIDNAGSVLFEDATGGRGTVVRVHLALDPPGGGIGRALGRMLSPITKQQVQEDLRRFKNLIEAGEIPTIVGQPAGKRPAINPHNPF
jgi:uncharacterized membrane protein